jgi:hypothetical protein
MRNKRLLETQERRRSGVGSDTENPQNRLKVAQSPGAS